MEETALSEERREYFRIKNWIIINHEPVDSTQESTLIDAPIAESSPRIVLLQELTQLENDNQAYLASLTNKQSQLGNYLINLNKKVELLTHFVIQSLNNQHKDLTEVDISGGGIRFKIRNPLDIDQLIKLEIVLIPECFAFVTFGRVVDCRPIENSDLYEAALIFAQLKECDRDAIIKHVFTLQSKQLRNDNG